MGDVERWWRVVPRNGRSVWLQQDPTQGMLDAAWSDATVEGPFVPEANLRGAVEALQFYGLHLPNCALLVEDDEDVDCDCGYSTAIGGQ